MRSTSLPARSTNMSSETLDKIGRNSACDQPRTADRSGGALHGSRVMPDAAPEGAIASASGRDAGPADAEPSGDRGARARARRCLPVRVRGRAAAPDRLRRRSRRARGADPRAARASRRQQHRRLRRQRWPFPRPRARALLAARGRVGPGRARGRQHRARADRLRHAARPVPPVVDPHRRSRAPGSSSRPCSRRSPTSPCR